MVDTIIEYDPVLSAFVWWVGCTPKVLKSLSPQDAHDEVRSLIMAGEMPRVSVDISYPWK